jgi:hypothetical protein
MKLLNKPAPAKTLPQIIKIESVYRIIVIALLASILTAQIAIFNRFTKPIDVIVQNSKPIDVDVKDSNPKIAHFGW